MPRTGLNKDTLQNLIETGECVVNVVNADSLEKMNATSSNIAIDQSEFDFADIQSCASESVKPLSVSQSPIRYECTLREVVSVSDFPLVEAWCYWT